MTTNNFKPEGEQAAGWDFDYELDHPSRWAIVVSTAEIVGCVSQTLPEWVKKA